MAVYLNDKMVGVIIKIADPISNAAYVKQYEYLNNISIGTLPVERDYSSGELERLEIILINLTGGLDE